MGLFDLAPSSPQRELTDFVRKNERLGESRVIPYRPSQTPEDVLRRSRLPYLPILGFDVPVREMFEEAKRLEGAAIPHRYGGESHRGWKSLVLHGISSVHTQGAERYGMDPNDWSIYGWTDIARLCPVTTEFFRERFHYERFQRVRFMYLEPGGFVLPHTDADQYYLGPVNIALNNPEGCRFLMENVGVVPFSAGTINKLALINRHCVLNESDEMRIHVIVHGAPDEAFWRKIYLDSYREFVTKTPGLIAREEN